MNKTGNLSRLSLIGLLVLVSSFCSISGLSCTSGFCGVALAQTANRDETQNAVGQRGQRGQRLRQFLERRRQMQNKSVPGLQMPPGMVSRNKEKAKQIPNYIGDIAYGQDPLQTLDLYTVKPEFSAAPVVFFVHGGGWHTGDKTMNLEKGQNYAREGILFVNVNYRLAPKNKHPEQIEDIAKAFAWTKANAKKYGGDPERIFVMGHSAGAHLVDLLATNDKYLQEVGLTLADIKGVVSLDTASVNLLSVQGGEGVESQLVGPMITQAFGKDKKTLEEASPTLCLSKGKSYPPFLLYCGSKRKTAGQTHEEFVRQCKGVGGTACLRLVPFNHKEINVNSGTTGHAMFNECQTFIKTGKLPQSQ